MASFQLPKCLYLTGVVLEDPMHVASGGYADIHIGKYLGRRVALKTMRVFAPQQPGEISKSLRTFCREITLLRSLDHPNICGLIGVDRDLFGGRFCLVTDWMLHGNIMDFISANSFVLGEAQQFVIEMASALAYLHSKNVVHGDLHVRNILIDAGRHVRLADFGLSDFSDTSSASMSSADAGAARYMAPEVLLPTKFGLQHVRHTPSSDVHSFAMCVWTIFHGNSPFHDYPVVAASMSILDGLRPSWCTARHDIPEPLWSLLSLCWQQEARHRPSSSDVYSSVSRMFRYSSPPSADSATPAASRRRISRVTSPYQEVDSPESESASSSRPESSSGRSSARQLLRQHRSVQSPTGPPDIARWTIEQALGRHSVRSVRDTAVPRQRALRPLFPIARPSTSPPTMARAPQPPAQTVWHAASQFPGAERLVPQVTYRPSPAQQLSRTLSSQAALMPPAVMFNVQGRHGCGISCAEVFHGRFVELQDPETLIECPRAMVLRIMWPGYEPWSATIMHTETTRKNLAMSVSVHTHVFFNRAVGRCLRQDIRWKLGPGAIAFSDLELVGLQPVGVQDWQAHFRVRSEAPYF
ncbi:kinase-like domain-containing protein [Phanerochaete sordida]|uniref:Kinase-like domain-containing protein n=1 Tax=Phanerochaete sordida TaxID=48140 RepID=A0A9P3GMZ7_9APHY|nr:kinase-like domain-containing protein [Phanerochaete sordida]